MGTAAWRARAGVLVLMGAFVVHELRYVLAGRHPDEHAHAYMGRVVPFACALLVLAALEFAVRLVLRKRVDARSLSAGGVRWLALSCLLIGIFAVQESAEMLLEHGRLDVTDSLAIHGGWLAAPLSFAVAGAIALLLRGAKALLIHRHRACVGRAGTFAPRRALPRRSRPLVPVIACNLAGRAPPSFVN